MNEARPINEPLEIWVNRSEPEIFFQIREKRPATDGDSHEIWIVDAFSPDDGLLPLEEAYAETIEETCTCVWRESDNTPLPAQYRIEEEE